MQSTQAKVKAIGNYRCNEVSLKNIAFSRMTKKELVSQRGKVIPLKYVQAVHCDIAFQYFINYSLKKEYPRFQIAE